MISTFVSKTIRFVPWTTRDKVKNVPILAPLLRRLVSRALDGKEFVHVVDAGPAKGVSFSIRMPADKGIWTGTYEYNFANCVAAAVRPGMIAYDVGSWHGYFAAVMAAQGAERVYAFDPLPQNIEHLRRFAALNPCYEINIHECALGECDSKTQLVVAESTSMAKLESSPFQPHTKGRLRIPVLVRTLDSLVANDGLPRPQVLKIDVEGAEFLVLKGAVETLRVEKPTIFLEVHSRALLSQIRDLLVPLKYDIAMLGADNSVSNARDISQIRATPGR